MLADPETEPTSPRLPDEVGTLDSEAIEDRNRIRDTKLHRVGGTVVGFAAATETPVVCEDESKLVPRQRPGDLGLA